MKADRQAQQSIEISFAPAGVAKKTDGEQAGVCVQVCAVNGAGLEGQGLKHPLLRAALGHLLGQVGERRRRSKTRFFEHLLQPFKPGVRPLAGCCKIERRPLGHALQYAARLSSGKPRGVFPRTSWSETPFLPAAPPRQGTR